MCILSVILKICPKVCSMKSKSFRHSEQRFYTNSIVSKYKGNGNEFEITDINCTDYKYIYS